MCQRRSSGCTTAYIDAFDATAAACAISAVCASSPPCNARNPNDDPRLHRSSTPGVASSWSSIGAVRSAVDEQVAEGRFLRRARLLREAEHALTDDVALHLVGAAVD